jgi:hypothetical protein
MTQPFTFEYNAMQGVLIAATLREKAQSELYEADRLTDDPVMRGLGAEQARNRARLFQEAAESIHDPVREALAADMAEALDKGGI